MHALLKLAPMRLLAGEPAGKFVDTLGGGGGGGREGGPGLKEFN